MGSKHRSFTKPNNRLLSNTVGKRQIECIDENNRCSNRLNNAIKLKILTCAY